MAAYEFSLRGRNMYAVLAYLHKLFYNISRFGSDISPHNVLKTKMFSSYELFAKIKCVLSVISKTGTDGQRQGDSESLTAIETIGRYIFLGCSSNTYHTTMRCV